MGRRLLDVCKVLPEGPVECAVEGTRFEIARTSVVPKWTGDYYEWQVKADEQV